MFKKNTQLVTATLILLICTTASIFSQHEHQYTKYDTLRGSITEERAWWDLLHYDLSIEFNSEKKTLKGVNTIRYKTIAPNSKMQIDLQHPLKISQVVQDGQILEFTRDSSVYIISLKKAQYKGAVQEITINYSGTPHEAIRAPWDGGISWKTDSNGNPFIATTCQGIGSSIWWPCKDHMYDEPDAGMLIHITVPDSLSAVANGQLIHVKDLPDSFRKFTWQVVNPINNYGVNVNIGDYVHFGENYEGENGDLDLDYWVLSYNLEKAKVQFRDVTRTMKAFEYWFGPYPFYEDGYKLVEVPYPGMEHQSSVTYGNGFANGYNGRDVSATGWGKEFDFIIIHESGHEWFANNITYKDMADMWIHESFTAYSESLFVEFYYGKEAGFEYVRGTRSNIVNRRPLIADYDVNHRSDGDIYAKGANVLHTLRQWVNNDKAWQNVLRGLNKAFYHQTVTTDQIEKYMAETLGLELDAFFDQYLRDARLPIFEYRIQGDQLKYKWINCVDNFQMPIRVQINGTAHTLEFEKEHAYNTMIIDKPVDQFTIDPNYYVGTLNVLGSN